MPTPATKGKLDAMIPTVLRAKQNTKQERVNVIDEGTESMRVFMVSHQSTHYMRTYTTTSITLPVNRNIPHHIKTSPPVRPQTNNPTAIPIPIPINQPPTHTEPTTQPLNDLYTFLSCYYHVFWFVHPCSIHTPNPLIQMYTAPQMRSHIRNQPSSRFAQGKSLCSVCLRRRRLWSGGIVRGGVGEVGVEGGVGARDGVVVDGCTGLEGCAGVRSCAGLDGCAGVDSYGRGQRCVDRDLSCDLGCDLVCWFW